LSTFEGIHLRGVSTLFVFIVERGTDTIPDQPTKQAADRRAGQSVTGSATCNRCAEHGTSSRTEQSPGVFFRPRSQPVRASGAGSKRQTGDCNNEEFGRGHFDPRKTSDPAQRQVDQCIGTGGFGQNSG